MVRLARAAMERGRESSLAKYQTGFSAIDVENEADAGDDLAAELIHQAGRALGFGVRNLVHLFDPSVVVIGGGVSRIGARLWDPMRQVLDEDALSIYRQDLRLVPAELGDDTCLIGAALLAHEAAALQVTGHRLQVTGDGPRAL